MDALQQLISVHSIMSLDWIVKGPGLILVGLFLWRAVRSVFAARPMTVMTSVLFAVVIAVSLSRFGGTIQNAIYVQLASYG